MRADLPGREAPRMRIRFSPSGEAHQVGDSRMRNRRIGIPECVGHFGNRPPVLRGGLFENHALFDIQILRFFAREEGSVSLP